MSWFNRIRSTASRVASSALSGVRRVASNIIPESVQRKVTDFGNWLTDRVGPEQTSQVLNEIVEHVRTNYPPRQSFEVRESNSALRNFVRVYTIDGIEGYDAESFLDDVRENMTIVLRNNRRTKVKLILKCNMHFRRTDEIKPYAFHSNIEVNLDGTDEKELYDTMVDRILENIAKFFIETSDVRFHSVIKFELHTVSYKPLRGETWVPLPKELADKKAIINMQNKDNKCFLWCVLRALNPKELNPQRIDKKLMGKENTLNMEGIEYPVSLKDINKFEKQNPTISITVLGYEGKNVYPLRNSTNTEREHDINLMLIEKGGVKHYCLVKCISRLLSSQASNHDGKLYFCSYCLNSFWCQKSSNEHKEYCNEYEAVPKKGTMLEFKNYDRREKVPFLVYADFESFIKPLDTCDLNLEGSYTKQYQKHEPSGFCYYIQSFNEKVYKSNKENYTGENVAEEFIKRLEEDIKEICNIKKRLMIFGKREKERFDKATKCWICNKEFKEDDKKVRDHCHFTGRYRGAAHNSCNLNYKKPKFTPVVFHNLSGYDSHLFIKKILVLAKEI